MKEATGELNMTVVTVVAIAAVGAFFYAFVWPAIQANIESSTRCAAAKQCVLSADGKTQMCSYDADGDGKFDGTDDNDGDLSCPVTDTTDAGGTTTTP